MSIDLTTVQVQVIHGGYGRKLSPAVSVGGLSSVDARGRRGWTGHGPATAYTEEELGCRQELGGRCTKSSPILLFSPPE